MRVLMESQCYGVVYCIVEGVINLGQFQVVDWRVQLGLLLLCVFGDDMLVVFVVELFFGQVEGDFFCGFDGYS